MIAWLCRLALKLLGWHLIMVPPPAPKTVIIGYPHTSNWDFPIVMLARFSSGLPIYWVAKREMFEIMFCGLLNGIFKYWGGIQVDRRRPEGFVDQISAEFMVRDSFHLVIAPEGTRKYTTHWKSGFYRITLASKVPLGLGFIDWKNKRLGIAEWITLSGDREADLAPTTPTNMATDPRVKTLFVSLTNGRQPLQLLLAHP